MEIVTTVDTIKIMKPTKAPDIIPLTKKLYTFFIGFDSNTAYVKKEMVM
jgi:hypothetical protein